jgi:hypothetical protein
MALARLDHMQFFHMPNLAVMDRDAFIPYQFTGWTSIKPALRNAGFFEGEAAHANGTRRIRTTAAGPAKIGQRNSITCCGWTSGSGGSYFLKS